MAATYPNSIMIHPRYRAHTYPTPPREWIGDYSADLAAFNDIMSGGGSTAVFKRAFAFIDNNGFYVKVTDFGEHSAAAKTYAKEELPRTIDYLRDVQGDSWLRG